MQKTQKTNVHSVKRLEISYKTQIQKLKRHFEINDGDCIKLRKPKMRKGKEIIILF